MMLFAGYIDHSFVRTHSLSHVKELGNVLSKLCYKKLDIEYVVYYCRECGYIAHLDCAKEQRSYGATTKSVAGNSVDYLFNSFGSFG